MKLCLIAPVPPPYGGVSNWERIVERVIRKDPEIELNIINTAANKRPIDGRTIFDRVFYSGFVMIRADRRLKKLIKLGQVEHVHIATSGGLGFYRDILLLKRLKRNNIPVTYHIHFGRAIHYYEAQDRNWKLLLKCIGLATNVITIDGKTYGLLKQYKKNTWCINNPIDSESFEKYKDITSKKIVYVGWIVKTKGIEELIQAFRAFNDKYNEEYVLELVGRGQDEYINYLKKTYDCSNVSFVGEVEHDEAMRHIARGEVFVLPSYTEGSPNVILEAMALKKPIIATNVGSIPLMLDDGCGIVIKPKDIDEIVNALDQMVRDTIMSSKMAEKAYFRVTNMFDIQKIYEEYKSLWRQDDI